ncbi:uncharacterized protein N7459_006301 [Penicillium hispanicum]|uniref:uncharacterized protein n=1 Tax=Penicillium hispanicum TaxID=1080232 RepID=UPI0025423675|nr:uncharacterized protein N7459_006301 [Penicillium hispanicum]KAJ5580316.1 hypothetical protein N7459_006301 [Penicillium hispanicum]
MWILDSAGDFLNVTGKRVWLRPGKRYLFGRPQQDGGMWTPSPGIGGSWTNISYFVVHHQIQNKTVSRHHMIIEVSHVRARDGTRPHARTQVTVTDLNSKYGTSVNGNPIQGEHVLAGDENSLQIARYPHALRIKWEPVVLSFSFSSKEMRVEDPLAKVRSRLEDLDMKTIVPYLVDQTTHVVQSKRNTAKGLQALINGKFIVQYSYIDALVYASTPHDLENEESLSPLETDFDSAWPNAMEHLPPAGNEPVSRPCEAFAPNPSRINVFDGYTFVFGDASQFENLQPAINNGQGKALLYQIEDGVTSAADIVRFMREAGGDKELSSSQTDIGGVVLVRFRSKGRYEPWSIEVGNEVALMTDRRVIEQREFLDAILGNDASPLCRPLPLEEGPSQAVDPVIAPEPELPMTSISPHPSILPPAPEASQPSPARSKPSRVRQFVSKMKAFDDGFDMGSIPVYQPDEDDAANPPTMDYESQPAQASEPLATVEEEAEVEEEIVTDLLPGARAMKRRRVAMDEGRHRSKTARVEPERAPKSKRAKLDVLEAARKYREEEEQQRQAEDHSPLQEIGVEDLKNLAIVEEMDVPVRNLPQREDGSSDRWDERWNGRKNFKRFRRKGEPGNARQRVQSVIVPLEEVTRKEFGIGGHYWSSNRKSPQREERGQLSETEEWRNVNEENRVMPRPTVPLAASTSPDPAPVPHPSLSRSQSQKRPREVHDSDSDEGLRFRFRRKR